MDLGAGDTLQGDWRHPKDSTLNIPLYDIGSKKSHWSGKKTMANVNG